ncbi:MAG: DNA polymerase I [Calditrichaceae bacterium]
MSKKLFLVDGSAIYYRSYFAFIRNPLINSKGENTSATYGFLNSMIKLIEDENPDYVAVIFDTKEPTFRHKIYEPYKATREKMPDEMAEQYPRLVSTLKSFEFVLLDKDGYEADDIIGTLAHRFASPEMDVFIFSGDKDMAQLVNKNVFLYMPGKTGQPADILGSSEIQKKFGIRPEQIVDWLALIGDTSDNIPGIPKIGPKTATQLLQDYGSIDGIYDGIDQLKEGVVKRNLIGFKEQTSLSKKLATIDLNTPLNVDLKNLEFKIWDMEVADKLLKELEFRRLYDRMLKIAQKSGAGQAELFSKQEDLSVKYHLVDTDAKFIKLVNELSKQDEFVFDLETSSLDFLDAEIAGIAIAWKENEAYYIPLKHPDISLDKKMVIETLWPIFTAKNIRKSGQNIKYDASIMEEHGIPVEGIYFDTMIASYLIDPSGRQHNLDKMAEYHLNYQTIHIEELIGTGKNQKLMTDIPAGKVSDYAAEDADITLKLRNIFAPILHKNNQDKLFHELEMPLVPVLMKIERNGVKLDKEFLGKMSVELGTELSKTEKEIYDIAGEKFNINSPQQLGMIMFEKLTIHTELGSRKPQKTKTGQYSTSENILERYSEHPLIEKILNYRKLTKLKSTYIDALPKLIHPKTGKVHTSFNQTIAATGRLSSSNPNLQNIPIRTELGRETRKAFIASSPDHSILSADYSQIELRIMAHLSKDKTMIESFKNNADIHASTAALIFGIPIADVMPDHRRKAKEINFGIMYGMNEYGLANRLKISNGEAKEFIYGYFATYPGIQSFMGKCIAQASENGFVETIMHRRRYLPEIRSTNRQVREFAERTAINTPIQGSAADLIKKAMIDIHEYLKKEKIDARMILQVHDELVFDVANSIADEFGKKIKSIMENSLKLSVPIVVDAGIGRNWLEAHQ